VADGDRPQYQHGVGTIGGTQFHWGSGTPGQYWSIPYGDYPVTPNAPTGAWAHQAGAIPIANNVIPDPLLGRNRIGIMIHSGSAPSLDQLYTEGCFKVDPQDWPNVRSQILAQAEKGPLYLHVAPGGVAAFTNTKTFSQAGEDTPAATANTTANTTANAQGGGPSRPATIARGTTLNSTPLDIVLNAESGDRNIPNVHQTTSSGQAQGNAQITTGTWTDFAPKAGVDLKQYPTPMDAPRDVQIKVASQIPLNRWAPSTVNAVLAKYPGIDTSQPLGAIQSAALNPSGAPAAAPAAPPAVAGAGQPPPASGGLAGSLPGFQAGSPGAKMTAAGLQQLAGGGATDQPPPMQLQQAQPSQAMGGPMMMRAGQQNMEPRIAAMQALAQQGFMTQPSVAAFGGGGLQSPLPSTAQSTIMPMAPGGATGMPASGIAGTTLNSPSQLQMALMTGALSPYDMYARQAGS
jgi:hypothetical protein